MLAVKTEEVPSQDGPHFGLDSGLANLAVLFGPDVARFFGGQALRYARVRYLRYRQALQRKRKTGMVKRSKGREPRLVRCENHRVSRQIVDSVAARGGILHVEKLLGIRDKTRKTRKVGRMLYAWPFPSFSASPATRRHWPLYSSSKRTRGIRPSSAADAGMRSEATGRGTCNL